MALHLVVVVVALASSPLFGSSPASGSLERSAELRMINRIWLPTWRANTRAFPVGLPVISLRELGARSSSGSSQSISEPTALAFASMERASEPTSAQNKAKQSEASAARVCSPKQAAIIDDPWRGRAVCSARTD